ncbi:MAG: VCBS repeat-containing protein [Planctomycetes bacterium]|nr:VCBS repeat-containing protein [Planctomycetota bacterium]
MHKSIRAPFSVIVIFIISRVPMASAQNPLFLGQQFQAGSNPKSVAIAFVNGDGAPDIVTANYNGYNISVLLGNGKGLFGAPATYGVGGHPGYNPNCVAIADLNADGKADAVTANYNSSNISVLLGTGAGGFASPASYAAGTNPSFVAIGDLNADGRPDAAVANYNSNNVSVFLGTGNGAFSPATFFVVGGHAAANAIADLNGDGIPDLATANDSPHGISVLLGIGSGAFAPAATFALESNSNPRSIVAGDFNNDGKADIATANLNGNTVSIFPGDGTGAFASHINYTAGIGSNFVAVTELNGDGKQDLATSNSTDSTISVLLGNGDITFAAKVLYPAGAKPSSIAFADVDADGKTDLAAANVDQNSISVLLGNGDGTFKVAASYYAQPNPISIFLGDLDADGNLDAAVANITLSEMTILAGNGTGAFAPAVSWYPGGVPGANDITMCDLNGDSMPDVVSSAGGLTVLLANGPATFAPPVYYPLAGSSAVNAIADLDADGKPDVVCTTYVYNGISAISVFLGNGDGTLGASATFATGTAPFRLAVGDLNGDGIPDAATINRGMQPIFQNSISILLGNGNGTFGAAYTFNNGSGDYILAFAMGDLDGDGVPDLVSASEKIHTFSAFLGKGDGTYKSASNDLLGVLAYPMSLAIGDLTQDGKPDVIAGAFAGDGYHHSVFVAPGVGDGSFGTPLQFTVGKDPLSLSLGDVDQDGAPDIVTANYSSYTISILLNQTPASPGMSVWGTGTFGCAGILAMGTSGDPNVNSPDFGLICTNAPRNAIGLAFACDVQDLAGSDPFFLGLTLYVDLNHSALVAALDFSSDSSGTAFLGAPLPNDPSLAGFTFYAQGVFVENAADGFDCSPAQDHLVSSKGIAVAIQP